MSFPCISRILLDLFVPKSLKCLFCQADRSFSISPTFSMSIIEVVVEIVKEILALVVLVVVVN